MQPPLQHVFLDLDGTLTDPAPGIIASYMHVAESLGLSGWSPANLRRFIGPPLREAIATMVETDEPEAIAGAVATYREYFATRGLFENKVIEGVPEALVALRERGFTLHMVTSKALPFAKRIVDHFELSPHLTGFYGAELGGGRSAKAELIAHALSDQGLVAEQAVMVGDRKHDIAGANAQGVASIGVLWGYGSIQELAAEKPSRIVIDIADLADVVGELSRTLATGGDA